MLAALNNYPTTIKLLHEMGATDLSQGDRAKLTALAHAAMRGNKDCVAVLLSLGAEPHTEDFSGNTPLIWAARENHVGVIEKLSEVLQNLSNWTHRGEYNMSALEWATYLQHHKIANLIVLSINSLQTDARAQEAAQEMPSIEASEAISAQLPLPALLPNDRYRMLSRPSSRGVAIMINNVDFDNTDRRNGAMADTHETGLYQAFVKLGLRVETHHNLSSHFFNSHNLISLNRHETEYEQHDVFVLCVMSHGEDGHIIGSDGGRIELEPLFNQVRQCDSLAGKPKIFIVQACRLLSTSHPAESANVIRGQDCLYIYSACRGQLSGRDPNTGCIFIQALKDEILAADLRSVEFTHLLPKVVKRVLELTNGAQVVSSETTLSKLLYLPPTRDLLTNP